MRRLRLNRGVVIGGLLVAGLLAVALRPRPVEVEVATVVRAAMRVTIDEEGQTRIRDKFLVTAPLTGTLSRIELEPGDAVTRGQVLATMRPERPALLDARTRAELTARVDAARAAEGQARAEAQRATAMAAQAQADARRARPLNKAGAMSDSELETIETQARAAEDGHRSAAQAVRVAASQLEAARAALSHPEGTGGAGAGAGAGAGGRTVAVRAPIAGVVLRRLRESESVVAAGEALLEIGDRHQLEIVADFLSTDAVAIPPGAAVLVEQWGGGEELRGHVRRIEPSGFTKVSALGVEEQRVNVIIDFDDVSTAQNRLGDGYRVEVRAIVWEQADVLTVPVGSLFRQGAAWAVFVVEDGRAQVRPVEIGHRTDREAEVLEGLRAGEQVIRHPGDMLRTGDRVAARAS